MAEIPIQTTKLVAIYGRVSTSNQENEGTIETQLTAVKEHAQKHGYVIVREYTDEGWSGDNIVRPALDQLRVDAKNKIWQAVLVYDPDRLARRYSYQELVSDELREAGIEVIYVTVAAPKNSEDKILHGVRGLFAEYERAKISERFRLGKVRKVKEGHLLVSEPLYGYSYVPKNDLVHGYYVVNEAEARVIRMIFIWVGDEGLTLRGVVRRLHELAIKPRKSLRGVWNTSTLSKLLKNRAYIGEAHWGSSYAVVPENPLKREKYRKLKKSSRKTKPEAEWFTIPVPPIIDRQLFMRARVQIERNFALCIRNTKNEYLLAGRIWCDCGKRRSGEGPQRGKHLYYRCNDRVSRFPLPRVCQEMGMNARICDRLVWEKVAELMTSPDLIRHQINRWLENAGRGAHQAIVDVPALEEEISKLKEQADRYGKAYGAGLFTVEQLKEYLGPITEKTAALEGQVVKMIRQNDPSVTPRIPSSTEIDRFVTNSVNALKDLDFGQKRAIIVNVVEKVVAAKGNLQVHGYLPLESNVKLFTNGRHGVDTNRHVGAGREALCIQFTLKIDVPPLRGELGRNAQGMNHGS